MRIISVYSKPLFHRLKKNVFLSMMECDDCPSSLRNTESQPVPLCFAWKLPGGACRVLRPSKTWFRGLQGIRPRHPMPISDLPFLFV